MHTAAEMDRTANESEEHLVSGRRQHAERMRRARRYSRTRGGARFDGRHRRRNKRWGW